MEVQAPKPGYKTTEFWLATAATVLGVVMASGALDGLGQDHWLVKVAGLGVSILAALGYSRDRRMVKADGVKTAAIAEMVNRDPQ
jgi:hypothetical protein